MQNVVKKQREAVKVLEFLWQTLIGLQVEYFFSDHIFIVHSVVSNVILRYEFIL